MLSTQLSQYFSSPPAWCIFEASTGIPATTISPISYPSPCPNTLTSYIHTPAVFSTSSQNVLMSKYNSSFSASNLKEPSASQQRHHYVLSLSQSPPTWTGLDPHQSLSSLGWDIWFWFSASRASHQWLFTPELTPSTLAINSFRHLRPLKHHCHQDNLSLIFLLNSVYYQCSEIIYCAILFDAHLSYYSISPMRSTSSLDWVFVKGLLYK